MTEQSIKTQLRSWIIKHSKTPPGADFSDTTPLLEKGLLSSLDIAEFVLYIESLRGEEIDVEALEPSSFVNVEALYSTFFAAA